MTGVDHYRHSGSKGVNVNFVDESLAINTNCAETKFRDYWYYRKANARLGPIYIDTVTVVVTGLM